jgi:type VI secretion system protein ImpC
MTPLEHQTRLRLLVLADLAPQWGIDRAIDPLAVDGPAGVDAALRTLAPELTLSLPGRAADTAGPRELPVTLRFTRLADFAPDALARAVREAAPPSSGASGGDPLDALLSQVDLPAAGDPQVAGLLGNERLRALEAAWRGVALLAARTGPAVRLEILPAGREDFLDVFWERVFPAEHEGTSEAALSAVVLGYEFDRGPADIEVLRHAGRMGESLRVPFLGSVGPGFWGIRQARLLATLPDLVRRVEGSEYAKWNGLRREEAALWLCLAANRPTVRGAWGSGGESDRPLHAPGGFALGAALAGSFTAAGVRFPLTGAQSPGRLDDLAGPEPVEVLLPDQKALELSRVGLAPLVARKGEPGAFFAAAPTLQVFKRYTEEEASRSAAAVTTLTYQAFAGAAAHALQTVCRDLGGGLEAEEVRRQATDGLRAFLDTAGSSGAGAEAGEEGAEDISEEIQVEVQAPAESPDVWEVLARLRPAFSISGSRADLVLGSAVPR